MDVDVIQEVKLKSMIVDFPPAKYSLLEIKFKNPTTGVISST